MKLNFQLANPNADSVKQIPKKRCLIFKWEEWKKQK